MSIMCFLPSVICSLFSIVCCLLSAYDFLDLHYLPRVHGAHDVLGSRPGQLLASILVCACVYVDVYVRTCECVRARACMSVHVRVHVD
jgi:hypothetical protein